MTTEDKQFTPNFYQLPEEVQFYFGSALSVSVMKGLLKQFSGNEDALYRLIFAVVNNNFDFSYIKKYLPDLKIGAASEKSFSREFIGRIFWPLQAYLSSVDIKKALTAAGGADEDFSNYVRDFYYAIEDENLREVDVLAEAHKQLVDPEEEKSTVLELFSQDLVDILKVEAPGAARNLSGAIISLLSNDDKFKLDIDNALLENKLLLTRDKLIIDGKELAPTIANWLKDFIKKNGSETFNEVVLAQYLGASPNASRLSPPEKELLGRLLKLYRNLIFFPESLQDKPLDKWEIIPTEYRPEPKPLTKTAPAVAPVLKKSIPTPPQKPLVKAEPQSEIQAPAITPNILDKDSNELEGLLGNYAPGSLEHKAIKEELTRLKKKK